MVTQFCIRPTSKRWFLRIVQVIMKHDPFAGIHEDFYILLHLLTSLVSCPYNSSMLSSKDL